MRGEARLLCALGLVLLCVTANFQGAHCFAEGGGGHGGGGGFGGEHAGGGHSGEDNGGEGARQAVYGAGAGALAGTGSGYLVGGVIPGPHSAAGEPLGRVAASRASGTAAVLAAAALVWWL